MTDLVENLRDAAEELPTVYIYHQRDEERIDITQKMLDLAADKIEELVRLTQTLLENEPDDLVSDGGHTVLDLWRHNARSALQSIGESDG